MKTFTYSEARQNLAKLLTLAQREDVEIRRRDGAVFVLRSRPKESTSPFDIPGIKTALTKQDILEAVSESRSGNEN